MREYLLVVVVGYRAYGIALVVGIGVNKITGVDSCLIVFTLGNIGIERAGDVVEESIAFKRPRIVAVVVRSA